MSLFHRSRHTDTQPRHDTAAGKQHNTAESLKAELQRLCPTSTSHAVSTTHTALGILGLLAIAGTFFYANRNPRIPSGIHPVKDFNIDRYLGKWYEVARIDHSFEKGLQRTQAEYSRLSSGNILVTNRGYNPQRNEWRIAYGKAQPTISADIAALKVSFFGPFYSGYNVVALDDEYRWAMVVGSTLDYFWILSRTPSLPQGVQERLMHQAQQLGVDIHKVLWVHQDGVNPTGSYK